jgi:hypothetical protein
LSSYDNDYRRRTVDLLDEIAKWVRFQGIQLAKQVFAEALRKDIEKLAYHYSDGRSSAEIAKIVGVSDFAIRNYWKRWNTIGIAVPSSKFKGRYERLFSLDDLGIELPVVKKTEVPSGGTEHV